MSTAKKKNEHRHQLSSTSPILEHPFFAAVPSTVESFLPEEVQPGAGVPHGSTCNAWQILAAKLWNLEFKDLNTLGETEKY